jgi:hypothetical protein
MSSYFFLHRIRILPSDRNLRIFALFHLFGQYFTVNNAPKSCEKFEKNAQKMAKMRNANAMQKWNQNLHRIALL